MSRTTHNVVFRNVQTREKDLVNSYHGKIGLHGMMGAWNLFVFFLILGRGVHIYLLVKKWKVFLVLCCCRIKAANFPWKSY